MRKLRCFFLTITILTSLLIPVVALAQTEQSSEGTSSSERLFHSFVEDATIVDNQWWEAQVEYADGDTHDLLILRGVATFNPWKNIEIGARVGFGSSDASGDNPDGSGATDLDAWGKYHFGKAGEAAEFAVGAMVTIPTGDEAAGLGDDSFAVGAFGAMRYEWDRFVFSAHAGVRLNADGKEFTAEGSSELKGDVSPMAGVGVFFPFSDVVTFVGELNYEGKRFEERDTDIRALGGLNWRVSNRGIVRGAVSLGLTDGAEDAQIIVGYAVNF
jgi:hypothetical protein